MITRRMMVFSLAVGSLLAAGLPALAKPQHVIFDTDNDGTVDLAEAQKAGSAAFDKLERDHDGTLDKKEIAAAVHGTSFNKADADKDGTLDKSEYLALVEARFKAADTDHDGTISDAELSTKAGQALVRLLK